MTRSLLRSAGKDYELAELSDEGSDLPIVPAGRKGKGSLAFTVDQSFDLSDAVLTFGAVHRHQAQVSLTTNATSTAITDSRSRRRKVHFARTRAVGW